MADIAVSNDVKLIEKLIDAQRCSSTVKSGELHRDKVIKLMCIEFKIKQNFRTKLGSLTK